VAFFVLFTVLFVIFGGLWSFLFAFVFAYGISWLLRKLYLHKRLPDPVDECVLITGASQGLGKDAAFRLSELGFYVFAGIRNESDAKLLTSQAKNPAKIVPILLDITNREQIEAGVLVIKNFLKKKQVKLIGLINNAGYSEMCPLELIGRDKLTKQFDVNVVSHVSQAFLPLLREFASPSRTSRLIFVSSALGRINLPVMAPYCASKHALESVTDGFRMELRKFNIDVISIQPGVISTQFRTTTPEISAENLQTAKDSKGIYCSQDIVQFYSKMIENFMKGYSSVQSPPKVVSDVIEAAMLDSKPYTRYQAGRDSQLVIPIIEFIPERITDILLTRNQK